MSRDFLFLAGPLTPGDVKRQVAREYGFAVADLEGVCRKAEVVAARWEAIGRMHEAFRSMSLPAIARQFGNMDHTSVLNALRRLRVGRYADGQPRKVIMPRPLPVIPDRAEVRRLYLDEGLTLEETARRLGCRRSSVVECITPAEIEAMKRARAAARQPEPRADPLDHPSRAAASIHHLVDIKRAGHTAAWYRENCEISELEDARERRRLGGQRRIVVPRHDNHSWGGSPADMCAV